VQAMASRSGRTVGREALYEAAQRAVRQMSAAESKRLVSDVLEELAQTLERGETVKLSGFGIFVVRHNKERLGRNPKIGDAARVSARRVVRFKPSPVFEGAINSTQQGRETS
jgi:integration host factor subunit alpha